MSTLLHNDKAIQETNVEWQTQARGTNNQEYQIYVDCAASMGWVVKTYDEWLNS